MHTLPRDIWKKKFNIVLLILILMASPLQAQDDDLGLDIFGGGGEAEKQIKVEGEVVTRLNVDFIKNDRYEFTHKWLNKIYLSVSGDINETTSIKISALDKYYYFHSGVGDYYDNDLSLFELNVTKNFDRFDLSAGNLIVTWGVSDLSPIDVVNPTEAEELIFTEEEFSKLPNLMVKGDYYITNNTTLEGVYVPFYKPSHFVLINSDWSILPREDYYKIEEEYKREYGIDIEKSGTSSYVLDYPEDSPFNGEIGILLKSYQEGYDFQVALHYGWQKMPLPQFNPDLIEYLKNTSDPMEAINNLSPLEQISFMPLITFKPVRVFTAGGGISTSLGSVGIRSEIAIHSKSDIYNSHLELLHVPILIWNVGADYNFPFNIYGNVILIWAHFFTDEPTYLYEKDNLLSVLLLRGTYLHDTLTLENKLIYVFTQYQWIESLKATYKYTDSVSLIGSINIIDAEKDTLLYPYRKNDFYSMGVQYNF